MPIDKFYHLEVGDISHNTYFEMLGFWSLGDYWKQDSLRWTLEWFTDVLGLELERISVTVFAGDSDAPRDDEAVQIWLESGIPLERIYYLPKEDNWWPPVGKTGPCGPDSELFYDTDRSKHAPDCQPGCSCGKYIEIGNNVFMQYSKTAEGTYVLLKQRNIDVGIGLERTLCVHQRTDDVFSTDLFTPIVQRINELRLSHNGSNPDRQGNETALASSTEHTVLLTEQVQRLIRINTDHVRAAIFIIADGVIPGNVEQGYICRRLIRRAIRCGKVYTIGEYSMEVCGGPHVQHTGGMGRFHIMKAETIGQGVQRFRADLIEAGKKSNGRV